MRLMGLDVGSKTLGVALSDPLQFTAQGLEVIRRKKPADDLQRLAEIIEQYQVKKIVVGLPKNMDGTLGPQAGAVQGFIASLRERFALPVDTWDERLTTVAARKMLIQADVSRNRRKQVVDKMAAVIILQGYLDRMAKE